MDKATSNLSDLSKIPDNEFKQHFRDWMERDDVARSLQAKLRKDLIANFNKTTLGKKISNQSALSHRLTLSPLILALNTLVAEFLYAQNCHFTLSVFSTEIPYRNTLPDFENASHFRFSEHEIFEIFDALSRNLGSDVRTSVCQEYVADVGVSLLFVLLKNLLNQPKVEEEKEQKVKDVKTPKADAPTAVPEAKPEFQDSHFRYLNKYLIILSKKVREMSQNLERLQKNKSAPQQGRKSLETRKFENLNRSLEKISDNLRQLSLSKRKNRRLTAVVSAVEAMAKQFERCAMNFDQVSKGFVVAGGTTATNEKSYEEWVKDMRCTENGKIFLDRIEIALKKALRREREKLDKEMEQRLSIQKDILKTKYKQKLTDELIRLTSRGNAEDNNGQPNESFEKRFQEFETKHQELHHKIDETEKKLMERTDSLSNKETQTADDKNNVIRPIPKPSDTKDQIQKMVKTISEQERHIDHIVFDAKLRIQELEYESNQLDRTFREYLERQRAEKEKMRETTTSIWQNYALGKSVLEKKSNTYRPSPRTTNDDGVVVTAPYPSCPIIPTVNTDTNVPSSNAPSTFENPFRVAQRNVLLRSKTLTQESRVAERCTRHQQQPRFRLIEHNDDDKDGCSRTKVTGYGPPLRRRRPPLMKATSIVQQQTPELKLKDITHETSSVSSSSSSSSASSVSESDVNSSPSPRGRVSKPRRQLFAASHNRGPSSSKSNSPRMNSNGNKEADTEAEVEPLEQINKKNGDDRKKSIDVGSDGGEEHRDAVDDALSTQQRRTNDDDDVEDTSLQSFNLEIPPSGRRADDDDGDDKESKNDSWR